MPHNAPSVAGDTASHPMTSRRESPDGMSARTPDHVRDKIRTVISIHERAEGKLTSSQRFVERATAAVARPGTVYTMLAVVGFWLAANAALPVWGLRAVDPPPFFWLQGAIALYVAVMSTLVLTTQNRQNQHAERRDYLELQVNLLAEEKIAKIIALLEELRQDLPGVAERSDSEADAMQRSVDPKAVLSTLEQTLEADDAISSDQHAPERKSR
jgi:uncharacterized membrane protein